MNANNDDLLKNLMNKFDKYANYAALIKSFNDFLLSKQEVENGKSEDWSAINKALKRTQKTNRGKYYLTHECELKNPIRYPENIEEYKASIFKFGCYNSMPMNDRDDEIKISWDIHNNFLYNLYVYAMVHVIALNLHIIKGDNKWEIDEQYKIAKKAIKYLLEKTTKQQIQSDKLSKIYKPIECIMNVEYLEPKFLFGEWVEAVKRTPKINATIKEMLGWIELAKEMETKNSKKSEEKAFKSNICPQNSTGSFSALNRNKSKDPLDEKKINYDKKNAYLTILSIFCIGGALLAGNIILLYSIVTLIVVIGSKRAFKDTKVSEEILFDSDGTIKNRIRTAIEKNKGNIDIPFYGFSKVSDKVVDEVYHFFKDKRTDIEVSISTLKEFELPYNGMNTESLISVTKQYDDYTQQEKDGFSQLQKIKVYGDVLKNV